MSRESLVRLSEEKLELSPTSLGTGDKGGVHPFKFERKKFWKGKNMWTIACEVSQGIYHFGSKN